MFASGAMACAYSTSRLVSKAQLTRTSLPSKGGIAPTGEITLSEGGAGSPKSASKCARSCAIVGEPNASTTTMVLPRPV